VLGKGRKERILPVGDVALQSIKAYLNVARVDSGPLFISKLRKRISGRSIWLMVKTRVKDASLSSKISPHKLRHSFASHLLDNGADLRSVQILLGHESLNVTQIYTHITPDRLKKGFRPGSPPRMSDASTWFDLGCSLQGAERHAESLSAFERAQAIDPHFPFLRHRTIMAHVFLNHFTCARDMSEALVRDMPRDHNAWTCLCVSAHRCREWDKSLAAVERAFALNSNDHWGLYNYSIILCEFRRFKRARHLMNRAVALNPQNSKLQLELGLIQLAEGDYQSGWKKFELQWGDTKPFSDLAPCWRGESLSGKLLMVWPAPGQGHGDSILLLRYATALAERTKREGGQVVLWIHEPVSALFTRSLAEYSNELVVISKVERLKDHYFVGRTTVQCSLVFLPSRFGAAIPSKFPYLTPDPIKVKAWQELLSGDTNLKVGISWTGRADHARNDLRSVPIMELMRRLKDIPGVTFYSLQLDHPDEARAGGLVDLTREFSSFDDTAAFVSNLDLVISIDCVIAHLAGALNAPTWVMVDSNPYYGWGRYEKTTVWYRSTLIFRQQRMHQWKEVFEEVRDDLKKKVY
jgi:tetratricopeptide (TPR) repeat protein